MQHITLLVALVGSALVLFLRPAYALAGYIAVLVWYPDYLRVSIGTIDISAGRVVIAVLLLRCLCDSRIRERFVWSRLDTWIALSMTVYVGMYCLTRPLSMALENRAGFVMDTWFVYITTRLIVTDRTTLISFAKATSIVLVALAILGVFEAVTHLQPFAPLKRFRPWRTPIGEIPVKSGVGRWGLARAIGPFSHPIMFGTCFVMFLPLIWALRHQRDYWGKLVYLLSGTAIIGALSSMSSGPWVVVLITVFLLGMGKYRHRLKPALVLFVLLCLFAEAASNRPLHHVIVSYANPLGGSGYQRAILIDCAIEDFGKWWLRGYCGRDPGWGRKAGMGHTDLNNAVLMAGVEYGIWGVIALCSVFVVALRTLVQLYKLSNDTTLKSWVWSLGTILVAVMVAFMGVDFFGQPKMIFYCILGIVGSTPHLICGKTAQLSKRRFCSLQSPVNDEVTIIR